MRQGEPPTRSSPPESARLRGAPLIIAALLTLVVFRVLGHRTLGGFTLDLGSLNFPMPLQASFVMVYAFFGSAAALLLTWGFARVLAEPTAWEQTRTGWLAGSDAQWIRGGALAAFVMALLFHMVVLRGARLTDDEAAYVFMAELLSRGQLTAASHPLKEFFDNAFMINDGRMYSKYFLGWPLMLVPGVWLGIPSLMNALYFALTVPALYRVLQAHASSGWARGGVIVFCTAPMLLIGAATMMSHTACICVLTWAFWLALRAQREELPLRVHVAFAALLALAALIRPTSAIGLGAPLAIAWLLAVLRMPSGPRVRALCAFMAIALCALGLVLAINYAQTGDALKLAYARVAEYEAESQHAFSALPPDFKHVQLEDPLRAIGIGAIGLLRLSFALFGWPIGLLLALFAIGDPRARLAWWMCAGFMFVHLPMTDAGIDTFGPVHFFEIALPILVLTVAGLDRAHGVFVGAGHAALAPALVSALIATAWLGYLPVETAALEGIASDILAPHEAVESAGLDNAIVFAPRPFAAPCYGKPTRNYVYFRPNNDPRYERSVLWVNHLGLAEDKRLVASMPGRTGYLLLRLTDCSYRAVPIEGIDPKVVPPLIPRPTKSSTSAAPAPRG
jgi:hypothetical protein